MEGYVLGGKSVIITLANQSLDTDWSVLGLDTWANLGLIHYEHSIVLYFVAIQPKNF